MDEENDGQKEISELIKIDVDEIVALNLEQFLDVIAERAGHPCGRLFLRGQP